MNTTTKADKRFGQHFLTNPAIARRIADTADLGPDDTVLEIGPGLGILTRELLARAGQVTSVEIDRRLIGPLTEEFGGDPRFRLVENDILATDLAALFADTTHRIAVCANIPYNITAPIIEHLSAHHRLIGRAVLMVQREVADRLLAPPGSRTYGLPTINLAMYAEGRRIMTVAPGSFRPPPAVYSAVIALAFSETPRYPVEDEALFRSLTGAVFRQRRKMIRNTLAPFLATLGLDMAACERALGDAGVDPSARPETVSPEQFAVLTNAVAGLRGAA